MSSGGHDPFPVELLLGGAALIVLMIFAAAVSTTESEADEAAEETAKTNQLINKLEDDAREVDEHIASPAAWWAWRSPSREPVSPSQTAGQIDMFRKKQATTDDLPLSDPAAEAPHQVWDPIGAAPPNAPQPDIPLDDPELLEFLDAINAAKDADSEFAAITDGGLP